MGKQCVLVLDDHYHTSHKMKLTRRNYFQYLYKICTLVCRPPVGKEFALKSKHARYSVPSSDSIYIYMYTCAKEGA